MDLPPDLPLWRSLLYIPVTNGRFVGKAAGRGADAVLLDLEDSIPPAEKPAARKALGDAAGLISAAGTEVLVRINRPWRLAVADLEAAVRPEISGLCLPKLESADHLGFLDEIVEELERERGIAVGTTRFLGLIETPRGLGNVRDIARASARLKGLALGQEDYSAALGMPFLGPDDLVGDMRRVQRATREAGILPLGFAGPIAEITDMEAFRASAMQARALGMEGAPCVHPAQVPILNGVFSPTAEEIETAGAMIAAYDAALAEGQGAIAFRGRMIDVPVVGRARRVLDLHARIMAR